MTLNFDFEKVQTVEFGVGRDEDDNQTFRLMPVDGDVQAALREMAQATWIAMQDETDSPQKYEASEKHASTEYICLPLNDDLALRMRELHQANNLTPDAGALSDPAAVFCYFARMVDGKRQRITALRRATQFKGILKSRLIRLTTDALKLVEDRVFRLDTDFDLLIDSKTVHILHPSGFEFAGNLQEAILQAVPRNIAALEKDLPFVNFTDIAEYTAEHPRAARYLASIRGQRETSNIDKTALRRLCQQTGVEVQLSKGKITIVDGHELGFLEVLDRRRYELQLVKGTPERFRASSRRKIE